MENISWKTKINETKQNERIIDENNGKYNKNNKMNNKKNPTAFNVKIIRDLAYELDVSIYFWTRKAASNGLSLQTNLRD